MLINNLVPGMTLDQDVKDQQGRLLAPSGQEVTDRLIRVFKIWGIGEVRIKGTGDQAVDAGSDIPEAIRQQAEEIVRYRFQYNDLNDPFVHELFRISSRHKARRLFEQSSIESAAGEQTTGETARIDFCQTEEHGQKMGRSADKQKINVDQLIHKTLRLGTIPDIYYKIIAAINNPDTSLDDIAGIVSKDITLSAKVLQLVNSSFYSLRQKVDTLTWGLALIGTNQLMTIVSGVSAVSLFKNIPSQLLNMVSFWEHSIACGTAARLLSGYFPKRLDAERFFVAGLLHDIGRLIMVQNLPERYYNLFEKARTEEIFLFAAEQDIFSVDHSRIGAELARHWNLPENLANMIEYHHFPAEGGALFEAAIINLADIIVNALEIGNSGEYFVPMIEPGVCSQLALEKEMLQPVVNEIDNQLQDIFEIIYGISE